MTINDVEMRIPALLTALNAVKLSPELEEVRNFLLPPGFVPVIQLEEGGRKKRSSAAAWNWNPETGDVRIYYDPAPAETIEHTQPGETAPEAADKDMEPAPSASENDAAMPVSAREVIECCQSLAVAERSPNRQFIALKWFRESFLTTVDFPWAQTPEGRHRVLSYAIDLGRIETRKIANPKSDFATTAISLNQTLPTVGVAPRFQPVPVRGEPASVTLLRDRGPA